MRQHLSEKKVKRLRAILDLPIEKVLVRGNTDHRLDLCLDNGRVLHYWEKDQSFEDWGWKWDKDA